MFLLLNEHHDMKAFGEEEA